jgi:hypothetical protein
MLSVSGERKFETEEKKENFRPVERQYGAFSRSFHLPASADSDNISAHCENGTLRIDIAKRADSRTKQIKIAEDRPEVRKLRNSIRNRAGALFTCPVFCNPKRRSR